MTKPAPMMAARICATSRVRLGPISRNSNTVIAIAMAAAVRPMAMTTPNAESHRDAATDRENIDEGRR